MSRRSRFDTYFVFAIGFNCNVRSFFKIRLPFIFSGLFFLNPSWNFPIYYLFFLDFDIISLFTKHFLYGKHNFINYYFGCRWSNQRVVRWISLGTLTLQAAEIIKPFLLIFLRIICTRKIKLGGIIKTIFLMVVPVILIFYSAFFRGFISSFFRFYRGSFGIGNKENKLCLPDCFRPNYNAGCFQFSCPVSKIKSDLFINPYSDPYGTGYNSIQSQIAVGDGRFLGRGLGKGIQTQLSFLPEKQTDFIFAAISEEMGFIGSGLTLVAFFILFWRITVFMNNAVNPQARAYLSGIL